MFVKMISTAAGPRLPEPLQAGKTYEVDDVFGQQLVDNRDAAEVENPSPHRKPADRDSAIEEGTSETAALPGAAPKSPSLMDRLKSKSAKVVDVPANDAPTKK
jgi:hypothetical protein